MFDKGGNAIDAAVASGYALNVLEPQSCGIGGEVPILVYSAKEGKPFAISGQGWVGKAATVVAPVGYVAALIYKSSEVWQSLFPLFFLLPGTLCPRLFVSFDSFQAVSTSDFLCLDLSRPRPFFAALQGHFSPA